MNQLKCSQCKQPYNRDRNLPKQLICNHVICLDCLVQIQKSDQSLKCPLDQNPSNQLAHRLPTDKTILNQIIQQSFRQDIPSSQSKQNAAITQISQPEVDQMCQAHNKKLVLYCIKCEVLICQLCAQYGEHQSHQICDLKKAWDTIVKEKYKKLRQQMEIIKQDKTNAIEKNQETIIKFEECYQEAQDLIQQTKQEIIQHLEQICIQMQQDIYKQTSNIIQEVKNQKLQAEQQLELLSNWQKPKQFNELLEAMKKLETLTLQSIEENQEYDPIVIVDKENVTQALNQLFKFKVSWSMVTPRNQITQISTVKANQNQLSKYDINKNQFDQIQIPVTAPFDCFINILSDDSIVITGGMNETEIFGNIHHLKFSNNQIDHKQYKQRTRRYAHQGVVYNQNQLFLLSGVDETRSTTVLCESINILNGESKSICNCRLSVAHAGACIVEKKGRIYLIAGYNSTSGNTDAVQLYSIFKDQWDILENIFPAKASNIHCLFLQKSNKILIWGSSLKKTYHYDFSHFYDHGDRFGMKGSLINIYSQPVEMKDKIYVWDKNLVLYAYDVSNMKWYIIKEN